MFKKAFIITLMAFLLFGVGIGCKESVSEEKNPEKTIPEATTLEGEDIAGLTYEEFEVVKEKVEQDWNEREITLVLDEEEKVVNVRDLGFNFYFDNDDELMERAAEYQLDFDYCAETMENKIEDLFPLVLQEPQDAQLIVEQEPSIKEHRDGERIDLEGSVKTIVENAREDEAVLLLESFSPEVTTEDIERKGVKELISSYSTEFNPRQEKRSANLKLAVNNIDHTLLSPEGIFSFNKTAGPYTADRGFQSAPVYRAGTVTTGIGGGVCQVSSTLYNAVLLAGLETVERYSHSLPVWYVPLARDAAVSYGNVDLRFKNSLGNHIYIRMNVDTEKGLIETRVFGTKETEVTVDSKIEKWIDPPVEEKEVEDLEEKKVVEDGQQGYEAISWRYLDGEYEFLSRDYYSPMKRVVEVPLEKEEEEKEEPAEDEKEEDEKEPENGETLEEAPEVEEASDEETPEGEEAPEVEEEAEEREAVE